MSRSTSEPTRSSRSATLASVIAVAIAVVAVYARTLDAPFIFDDTAAIVQNPSIRHLWPLVGDAETRGPLNAPPLTATARRPLPNLTLALNYRVGGLDPVGYHIFNLLVHVLNAVMLAVIVRRTLLLSFFDGAFDDVASPVALGVALVWALHPLASEAVVYVTQRTELLATLCYLLTVWAALRYWAAPTRHERTRWGAVAGVAALAGAASKEFIVSVPLVLLMFEWTFFGRAPATALRRAWPLYLGLVPSWALLVVLSVSGIGGLSDARHHVAPPVWWLTQTRVLWLYVKLALWPSPLSIHYAPRWLSTLAAAWPWVAAAAILTIATFLLLARRSSAGFVIAAALTVLAPTFLVPLPKVVVAERRMYLPLAGLVALALAGAYRLAAPRIRPARARTAIAIGMLVVAVGAGMLTAQRLGAYATAVSIWADAVRHQPDDAMAHYNLGVALLDADRPDAAVPQFEATLRIEPDHTGALDNLGLALQRLGRNEQAVARFEEALRVDPDDVVAHNNLGALLTELGRPREAVAELERALQLPSQEPKAKVHANLGKALLALGRTDDALAQLEQAVTLDGADADTHSMFGVALMRAGRPAEAVQHFEAAVRRKGDSPDAHNNLGVALSAVGRTDDAITEFEHAVRLAPGHLTATYNLGNALLDAGRPREALTYFRTVLQRDPGNVNALWRSAVAYERIDDRLQALTAAQRAHALAQSRHEDALAAEIDTWLNANRGPAID